MTVGELGRRAKGRNFPRIVDFFLIVSSAMLLMLPSLLTGAPEGHDAHAHFVYADAFAKQMAEGDLYPRWLEHLWLGAGGPDFYFYAPLPYWLAGTLRFIACPGCDASQLLALTGFVLLAISGLGFRAFALRFASRGAANVAAILYMALPYHLGADWYDRLAFGEFMATALLPWLLAAFIDCASGRSGGVRLALLSGLVVLSHLPSTMIVATGCLGLMLFTGRERGWRSFSTPIVAGVIGFGLAAFYWYPAVTLLDSIRDDLLQLPYTQWRYNTLQPANFGRSLFYDMIWLPFTLLSASALAVLLVAWRDNRAMARIVVALLVVVWLMVTPLSTVLWDMTPIKRIQFPWRFFILADIAFGLAAVMAVEKLTDRAGSGLQRGVAAASLCAFVVVTALFAIPGVRGRQDAVISPEVTVWMSAGNIMWLPSETPPTIDIRAPMHVYALAESLAVQPPIQLLDPGNAEILAVERRRLTFEVELPAPGTVVIRRTFWRYWRLRDAASGREIELQPATGFPLITAELPAGRGQYVLELPVLMAERLGALISAFALAVLLCWWWLTRRRTGS